MPERIQRRRTKGWRMPENTVSVTRGTRWGNPFKVGVDGTAAECVVKYRDLLMPYRHHGPTSTLEHFYISESNLREIERELEGKNLACWCAIGQACHGDLLLELAIALQIARFLLIDPARLYDLGHDTTRIR